MAVGTMRRVPQVPDAGRAPFHYLDCSRVQLASRSRETRGMDVLPSAESGGVGPPGRAGATEESQDRRGEKRTNRASQRASEGKSRGLPERGDGEARAAGWTDRPGSL